jgi:predicted transposase/invertase (TIGR01784 family)
MSYPVNPRIDLAFKRIFGVEENKDLTIALLNSIISEEDQVEDITLLNPYNPKHFAEDKLSILDIKARGCNGKLFNIEIQVTDESDYDKRALYYWGKVYTEQLKQGQDYGKLEKAIGIHILNFTSILENKKYHNVFRLTEVEDGFVYFKDIELHTIELNKFENQLPEKLNDLVKKIKTSLDVWSSFLTKYDLLNPEKLPKELDNPQLKKALEVLEHINMRDEEREAYENRLKWLRVETNALNKKYNQGKEEGLKEGEARGIEKGKKEGLKEGEAKGIEKGKEEGKREEKRTLARALLQLGQDSAFVAKAKGLSTSEVENLFK